MINNAHPERLHAESDHCEDNIAPCNVFHFPAHHDGRISPLSRYIIPPAAAFVFRALAAKRPCCTALIDELIRLDALIEAKKGLEEPAIIDGMALTHDLILLQIRAIKPATEAYAVLRRSILQEYRPKTTTYSLLPELLGDEQPAREQAAATGASCFKNKS